MKASVIDIKNNQKIELTEDSLIFFCFDDNGNTSDIGMTVSNFKRVLIDEYQDTYLNPKFHPQEK